MVTIDKILPRPKEKKRVSFLPTTGEKFKLDFWKKLSVVIFVPFLIHNLCVHAKRREESQLFFLFNWQNLIDVRN